MCLVVLVAYRLHEYNYGNGWRSMAHKLMISLGFIWLCSFSRVSLNIVSLLYVYILE